MTPFAFLLMVTNAQVYKQVSRAFLKIPHQLKRSRVTIFEKVTIFCNLSRGHTRAKVPRKAVTACKSKKSRFFATCPEQISAKEARRAKHHAQTSGQVDAMCDISHYCSPPAALSSGQVDAMRDISKNAAPFPIKARDKLQKIVTFRARTTHRAAQTRINI